MPLELGDRLHPATLAQAAGEGPQPAIGQGEAYQDPGPGKEAREGERISEPASVPSALLAPPPLPCLHKNHNCNEKPTLGLICKEIPSAKRTAFALGKNVAGLCQEAGLERVGFLTLTFAEHVLDPKEAQRRFHSLRTGVLGQRYRKHIRIYERQKSGRIHYHLLVTLDGDIRTGCDFEAFESRDYRSAPARLRTEWAFWRGTAKKYGFGRTELLPVKSTADVIGQYVGKYIGKHVEHREARDRGVRLVNYSGSKIATTHFAWAGGNAKNYRAKLGAFIAMMARWTLIEEPTMAAMKKQYGPRWCHQWREQILSTETLSQGQ